MVMESGPKRGKILVNTDDKNRKIYGDDFNYYSAAKSYNLAMPGSRHQLQNMPFLMSYPRIIFDFQTFENYSQSQCELLYFYINQILDYQIHLMLKNSCE